MKNDVIASVEDDLKAITALMANDPTFKEFLNSPSTSRVEKTRIAEKLFNDRVTAITMQTLRVLIEKGRELEIPSVYHSFAELRRAHNNVQLVTVTSSQPLDASQQKALESKLKVVLSKDIEATYLVNSLLIGGITVAYDSFVLDGSVKGSLAQLREKLRYDLLKQS